MNARPLDFGHQLFCLTLQIHHKFWSLFFLLLSESTEIVDQFSIKTNIQLQFFAQFENFEWTSVFLWPMQSEHQSLMCWVHPRKFCIKTHHERTEKPNKNKTKNNIHKNPQHTESWMKWIASPRCTRYTGTMCTQQCSVKDWLRHSESTKFPLQAIGHTNVQASPFVWLVFNITLRYLRTQLAWQDWMNYTAVLL